MSRYKVSELISTQDEIKKITTGLKNAKLYFGEKLICEDKDISKFYIKVLSYLANKENVDIGGGLGSTYNETGEKINDASEMRDIEINGTKLWVDTKSNNENKYKKMLKCFEILKKTKDITSYEFEFGLEPTIINEKDEEANKMDEKIDDMIEEALKKINRLFLQVPRVQEKPGR